MKPAAIVDRCSRRWAPGWLALALILTACGSKGDDKSAGDKAGGDKAAASPRDAVVDAWKGDKLTPSALAPAKVAFGADCQSGSVADVDFLLCNYGSPAEAKAAEPQGYSWVGSATGMSQAHGAVLVVLVDRHKDNQSNRSKTINQLMKLAPN